MSHSSGFELEPTFEYRNTAVVSEGDEVYVRGIGDKLLGIGTFVGNLVLSESNGARVCHPILEVQGELITGGDVDLWSPDDKLIEEHRQRPTYPIADYINEGTEAKAGFRVMLDTALATQMGVTID